MLYAMRSHALVPTLVDAKTSAETSENTIGALETIARDAFMISSFRLTHVLLVLGSCTHPKDVDGSGKDGGDVGARKKTASFSSTRDVFVLSFFFRCLTHKYRQVFSSIKNKRLFETIASSSPAMWVLRLGRHEAREQHEKREHRYVLREG
ncbi:hypothetical protein PsorP6_017265 [Peronosclerospora sorghi]|uniref:Uncharacterized protein n=1 Tax=Peronosclerospora sorghi TaxID=230839 RepID=A0ACC0WL29_9STRA|nr:hypothetical protein PsorP6_017265 [Peronosclerospora sorghi]